MLRYYGEILYFGITTLDDKGEPIHKGDGDFVDKYEIDGPYMCSTLHGIFENLISVTMRLYKLGWRHDCQGIFLYREDKKLWQSVNINWDIPIPGKYPARVIYVLKINDQYHYFIEHIYEVKINDCCTIC